MQRDVSIPLFALHAEWERGLHVGEAGRLTGLRSPWEQGLGRVQGSKRVPCLDQLSCPLAPLAGDAAQQEVAYRVGLLPARDPRPHCGRSPARTLENVPHHLCIKVYLETPCSEAFVVHIQTQHSEGVKAAQGSFHSSEVGARLLTGGGSGGSGHDGRDWALGDRKQSRGEGGGSKKGSKGGARAGCEVVVDGGRGWRTGGR